MGWGKAGGSGVHHDQGTKITENQDNSQPFTCHLEGGGFGLHCLPACFMCVITYSTIKGVYFLCLPTWQRPLGCYNPTKT